MILNDFSGTIIAAVLAQKVVPDQNFLRHLVLNSLRAINVKHRKQYGDMVIAIDSRSWRKDYFPYYKYKRSTARGESSFDWNFLYETLNLVRDELIEHMPYKVIQHRGAEADDIIGTLTEYVNEEFGAHEPVLIVSNDMDFIQLQRYQGVAQWAPNKRRLIKEKDAANYLFEHIMRGDPGDGVPNILSVDESFAKGIRQSQVTKKKMGAWKNLVNLDESTLGYETYTRYIRNKKLIDLRETPVNIKEGIIDTWKNYEVNGRGKILKYLTSKKCRQLVGCIDEF